MDWNQLNKLSYSEKAKYLVDLRNSFGYDLNKSNYGLIPKLAKELKTKPYNVTLFFFNFDRKMRQKFVHEINKNYSSEDNSFNDNQLSWREFKKLPYFIKAKTIIDKIKFENMSYSEIAEFYNTNVTYIYSFIHRILNRSYCERKEIFDRIIGFCGFKLTYEQKYFYENYFLKFRH